MTAPDPRVGEIEARLSAATPGPWRPWKDNTERRGSAVETAWAHDEAGEDTELITDWCIPADAEFIAHAPADVSYLLAELRKAREALARVEALADELATHSDGRGLDYSDDDFDRGWHGANRSAVATIRAAVAAANGDGRG